MKLLFRISALVVLNLSIVSVYAEDAIEQKLDAAIATYDAELADAREVVLTLARGARDNAQREGALQRMKTIESETEEFERFGNKPNSVNPRAFDRYLRQLTRLNAQLESAYISAIKLYTRDDNIPSAEALQQELDRFLKNGRVKNTSFLPTGKWVAAYQPGNVVGVTLITRSAKAIFKDNIGRERIGAIESGEGTLTIRYDDFVEVWSVNEDSKQISVKHYHPLDRFPDKKPFHTAKLVPASP